MSKQPVDATSNRNAPIFLVGFMGAGKTTVGRALAMLLGVEFLDLDGLIEERAGKSVRAIFEEDGESEFRRLESGAIDSLEDFRGVVALGGGAFTVEENRRKLRLIGSTVWLDCSLDVCISRIAADKTRPLATSKDQMERLYVSRRPAYAQADFMLATDDETPEQIAIRIQDLGFRI